MQDWRWAAGGHPLAAIGGGLLGGGGASSAHISEVQRDAMARSLVVTALDEAVATVNRAVAHLAAETTRCCCSPRTPAAFRGTVISRPCSCMVSPISHPRSFVLTSTTLMATVLYGPYHSPHALPPIQSDEDTYAVFKRWERQLAGQYNAVVEGWRRVAAAVEAMDYGGALHLLPGIETAAARYGAGVMGL
ncbi:unnamed protein product [Closterium sp. NIES-53]